MIIIYILIGIVAAIYLMGAGITAFCYIIVSAIAKSKKPSSISLSNKIIFTLEVIFWPITWIKAHSAHMKGKRTILNGWW